MSTDTDLRCGSAQRMVQLASAATGNLEKDGIWHHDGEGTGVATQLPFGALDIHSHVNLAMLAWLLGERTLHLACVTASFPRWLRLGGVKYVNICTCIYIYIFLSIYTWCSMLTVPN